MTNLPLGVVASVALSLTNIAFAAGVGPQPPAPAAPVASASGTTAGGPVYGPMPSAQDVAKAKKMEVVPSTEQHPIYDTTNPEFKLLQRSTDLLSAYPVDKKGRTDWMQVIRGNMVQPRADLQGTGKLEFRDEELIMKNTKNMPYVKFPHNSHTMWLACVNCHDQIFIPKLGANKPSMSAMMVGGQACGVCHGKVSFPMLLCERCHSVPKDGQKAWW